MMVALSVSSCHGYPLVTFRRAVPTVPYVKKKPAKVNVTGEIAFQPKFALNLARTVLDTDTVNSVTAHQLCGAVSHVNG